MIDKPIVNNIVESGDAIANGLVILHDIGWLSLSHLAVILLYNFERPVIALSIKILLQQ